MAYLLDANVFIQAKRLHYGFDFCPAFWAWLIRENQAERVFSIEKVNDELQAGGDDLADWATERGSEFFLPPDSSVVATFSKVSDWVSAQDYTQAAVDIFLQIADFYIVAHALSGSHTVVSHEKPDGAKKQIKIPNVCGGLGVKCVTPFQMLRTEKARFDLRTGA